MNKIRRTRKELLDKLIEQGRKFQKEHKSRWLLNLQYHIVQALSESITISEAMQKILHLVCNNGRWVIGEIWLIDKVNGLLCLETIWNKPLIEASEFEAVSRKITFQKGIGLPGRVWQSGKPAWILDVISDTNFLRESVAHKIGLHGAFAFPIKSSSEVIGVMSFFSRNIEPPDEDTLKKFDAIGSQIGNFIERMKIQKNIIQEKTLFQTLIESLPGAFVLMDNKGNMLRWNTLYEKVTGYSADEIGSMNPLDFGSKADREIIQQKIEEVFKKGSAIVSEVALVTEDGREIPYFWTGTRVIIDNKPCLIAVGLDISEKKKSEESIRKMEEELNKKRNLEALGELAGGLAHDFNNLLTAILGNISLSKMYLQPTNKIYNWLANAEFACGQAKELSNRLLTFARGGHPFKKIVLIQEMMKDAVNNSIKDSKIACEFMLPDNLPPVSIDKDQMRYVFSHLSINAAESMPEGGILTVSAENVSVSEKDNLTLKEGSYVKVTFKDSGKGIPEDNLPKIFDPYFSTKEMGSHKGQGLGLSICYSIIKKHEGHITVESKAGAGTTFHIYLPAA